MILESVSPLILKELSFFICQLMQTNVIQRRHAELFRLIQFRSCILARNLVVIVEVSVFRLLDVMANPLALPGTE